MPYGEIPYSYYEEKMASTPSTDVPDDYFLTYARGELSDRTMDKPAFEHEERYGPNPYSNTILNLRYNGTRGEVEFPNHPEMFIGNMDREERKMDGQPNFEKLREHMTLRTEVLKTHMGDNHEGQIVDSPWTQVSINRGRQDINQRVKDNTKVFLESRGNDMRSKHRITYDAEEREAERRQNQIDDGQHSNIFDFVSSESEQIGGGLVASKNDAPWRNTVTGTNLEVEKYGRGTANGLVTDSRGGINKHVKSSHAWNKETQSKGATRQVLAATMAAAIKFRNNNSSTQADANFGNTLLSTNKSTKIDTDIQKAQRYGTSEKINSTEHTQKNFKFANQSDDMMAIGRHVQGDLTDNTLQNYLLHNDTSPGDISRAAYNTESDNDYGKENIMRIVRQKFDSNPSEAIKFVLANVTDNEHLTNLGSMIVKGLTPGSNPENVLRHALIQVEDSTRMTKSGINPRASANPEKALRKGETDNDYGTQLYGRGTRGIERTDDVTHINRKGTHDTSFEPQRVNAIIIAQGLKEGTAASKRQIAGSVIVDGSRADTFDNNLHGRGMIQSADFISTANKTDATIMPTHVANLQTHKYSSGKMSVENKVANSNVEKGSWNLEEEQINITSKKPEWRSATENQVSMPEKALFGRDSEVGARATIVKPKTLRPTEIEFNDFNEF